MLGSVTMKENNNNKKKQNSVRKGKERFEAL